MVHFGQLAWLERPATVAWLILAPFMLRLSNRAVAELELILAEDPMCGGAGHVEVPQVHSWDHSRKTPGAGTQKLEPSLKDGQRQPEEPPAAPVALSQEVRSHWVNNDADSGPEWYTIFCVLQLLKFVDNSQRWSRALSPGMSWLLGFSVSKPKPESCS